MSTVEMELHPEHAAAVDPSRVRRWKRYPEYRDSAVEWLGKVPAHWEVSRTKFVAQLKTGHTPSRQNPEYWQSCSIPWFGLSDVWQLRDGRQEYISETKECISELGLTNSAAVLLPKGTVIVSRTASVGFSGVMARSMATTQDFVNWVCGPRILPEFLLYVFRGMRNEFRRLTMGSTHQTIYMPDVARFTTPVPPVEEQHAIVALIRRETARIDALVARKERLIELLQEKRTALISHAVTKGLDPDTPMRDSGVEWLGEVPAGWEVNKIKHLCQVKRGASPRPIDDPVYFDEEGSHAWVRISDVSASERYLLSTEQRLSELGRSKSVSMKPGDLFLSIAGTVGKPIITQIPCCIHDGFVYFTGLRVSSEYLYYIFAGGEAYKGLGKLGTQLNLNTDTVGEIRIPIPSVAEQRDIVCWLDSNLQQLNRLIGKVREHITRLQEYRTALISAAVTGKIDVREEVAA